MKRFGFVTRLLVALFVVLLVAPPAFAGKKVVIGQAGDGLIWIPLYVAREKGFLTEQGIDPEITIIGGGAKVTAALIGGSLDVNCAGLAHVIKARAQGIELVSFMNLMDQVGLLLVYSEEAMKSKGLTAASSLDDKVRAVKGLRIGVSSPGSTTDLFLRGLMKSRGMDPDRDVRIVPFGSGGPLVAALEKKQLDGFVYTSPFPEIVEARGLGKIVVNAVIGEVPELRGFAYQTLFASREYLDKNPETVLAFTKAMIKAIRYMHADKAGTIEVLRQFLPDVDPQVLARGVESHILATPRSPRFDEHGVTLNYPWAGVDPAKAPMSMIVTNRFVDQALKEMGPGN